MQADLTPENADFLQSQVTAGQFATDAEALNAAVSLLRRRAAFHVKIRNGLTQLENGHYVDLDDDGLDRFFDELFAMAGRQGSLE